MAPTVATVVLSVAAALSCVSAGSGGAQQPEPTIPKSFKTELHMVMNISSPSGTATAAGAGYMIVDSSAGAKGKERSRERQSELLTFGPFPLHVLHPGRRGHQSPGSCASCCPLCPLIVSVLRPLAHAQI